MNKTRTTKKLVAAASTAILSLALLGVGAGSASAITFTDYCFDNLRSHTEVAGSLPNKALRCQMQAGPARKYGYTGKVDGVLGRQSWLAIQKYLRANWALRGPITGTPDIHTYAAIQRAANSSGLFNKPVVADGTMALKDWQGWAYHVRINFFAN
ncbi:MAG: peptidase [Glaciihabitans sp.]|nr:peptidase [Glaciihabitans sp.]MCU1534550.1 peptidase [Glaciihabitans sp.]MDQ1555065.1 murein DD-endopeptidase [Actinomycetota bacterium]